MLSLDFRSSIFVAITIFSMQYTHCFFVDRMLHSKSSSFLKHFTEIRNKEEIFKSSSELMNRFHFMVDRFSNYTSEEIKRLENERLRKLVSGGKDALLEPQVLRAFEVLYEDYFPFRFGGDILFNLLEKSISERKTYNQGPALALEGTTVGNSSSPRTIIEDVKTKLIAQVLELSKEERSIDDCADSLFPDIDANGDGLISLDEFKEWVESVIVTDYDRFLNTEAQATDIPGTIFREVDSDGSGTISLDEFKLWTKGSLATSCDADSEVESVSPLPPIRPSKHRQRYLDMVRSFTEWESRLNTKGFGLSQFQGRNGKEDRIAIIIAGCFAGARNPAVVDSLGILYEDYLPLRLAGNLIFKLVEKAVSR